MVAAFPKIFLCPYHFLAHLKSILVTGISWKITQVKRMLIWLTFVRSEEEDHLGLLPSILSLHDHSLWGLSSCLLLLGHIPIDKWGLRPNTKVQAFAPTYIITCIKKLTIPCEWELIELKFLENFNLWRPLSMIVFYHQTKTSISFWYRRKLNPKFLIQSSKTLLVELTESHLFLQISIIVHENFKMLGTLAL